MPNEKSLEELVEETFSAIEAEVERTFPLIEAAAQEQIELMEALELPSIGDMWTAAAPLLELIDSTTLPDIEPPEDSGEP